MPKSSNMMFLGGSACRGQFCSVPHGAGHEACHILFNQTNSGHAVDPHNLFSSPGGPGGEDTEDDVAETYKSRRRLTATQQDLARTAHADTDGMLQKK